MVNKYIVMLIRSTISLCIFAEPRFLGVHLIPENENPEDDKIYLFFRENAMEGEHAGKATYARIGQLCKVSIYTDHNALTRNTVKHRQYETDKVTVGNIM